MSVIIPTYNRCEVLQECLSSVLAQTFADYEVIVVDDGSTDGTRESLATSVDHRVRCIYQENRGVSAARNSGIAAARGELIAFQDSDDLWMPEKLERQVALLDQHDNVGWVYCDMSFFGCVDADSLPTKFERTHPLTGKILKSIFVHGHPMSTPTVVVRRACLAQIGTFDECLSVGEDIDLWLRLSAHFDVDYVNSVLVKCRRDDFPNSRHDKTKHLVANCMVRRRVLDEHAELWRQCTMKELHKGYFRFVTALALHYLTQGEAELARNALHEFGASLPPLKKRIYLAGSYLPRLFVPLARRHEQRLSRSAVNSQTNSQDG